MGTLVLCLNWWCTDTMHWAVSLIGYWLCCYDVLNSLLLIGCGNTYHYVVRLWYICFQCNGFYIIVCLYWIQFSSLATQMFKLLDKYRPESKQAKKQRLRARAQVRAAGKTDTPPKRPFVVRQGVNTVTSLIEQKKAQLVVIAHDVDPIEVRSIFLWQRLALINVHTSRFLVGDFSSIALPQNGSPLLHCEKQGTYWALGSPQDMHLYSSDSGIYLLSD